MSRFGESLPNRIAVTIPTDEKGMLGRECPEKDCLGYFKIRGGTGLKGKDLPCHCPYCGHCDPHDKFWTPEQLEYAKSVALRQFMDAAVRELKKLEFDHKPRGGFGIGISLKFKPGTPVPIHRYREKDLETEVVCSACTLHYAIYGVFGYCPDCGNHNSLQIFEKNLELATKELDLATQVDDPALQNHLIGDALENVVSAFDGFGREACSVLAAKATNPTAVGKLSFQNLPAAAQSVRQLFAVDLAGLVQPDEWQLVVRCFQKRHLLAHKMGVIDEKYLAVANDPGARVGRKVAITADEVRALVGAMGDMARAFASAMGLQTRAVDADQTHGS